MAQNITIKTKSLKYVDIPYDKQEEKAISLIEKDMTGTPLTDEEKDFMEEYFKYTYPYHIGGDVRYIKDFSEKLKPVYENYVSYIIKNKRYKHDYHQAIFIAMYTNAYSCSKNGLNTTIHIEEAQNDEIFKKNEQETGSIYTQAAAYHVRDTNQNCYVVINESSLRGEHKSHADSIMQNAFHELRHETQEVLIHKEELIDPQALIWAKEYIARIAAGLQYYDDNYHEHFIERDARHTEYSSTSQYLKEHGLMKQGEEINYVNNIGRNAFKLDIVHKDIDGKEYNAVDLLDSIASEHIKNYPEVLNTFPVLKYVYNLDGTKKSIIEVMEYLKNEKEEKIKANPNNRFNIEQEYQKKLEGISKTDNDLNVQYLCIKASRAEKRYEVEPKEEAKKRLDQTIENVIHATEIRGSKYTVLEERLNKKISRLRVKIATSKSMEERNKYKKELERHEELIENVLKYNAIFKKQKLEQERREDRREEIEEVVHHNVTNMNYFAGPKGGDGAVHVEYKTQKELDTDLEQLMEELNEEEKKRPEDYVQIMACRKYAIDEFNRYRSELAGKNARKF